MTSGSCTLKFGRARKAFAFRRAGLPADRALARAVTDLEREGRCDRADAVRKRLQREHPESDLALAQPAAPDSPCAASAEVFSTVPRP